MYGDKLKKVTQFNPSTPNLFESDVPVETRVLVDKYAKSEELSKNHRLLNIDIEVEVTDGFPDYRKATNKITSIAIYLSSTDSYYAFVLDEKDKLRLKSKDNIII